MRHTFTSYLYEYTKDLKFVTKCLGPEGMDHVHKYGHIDDSINEQISKCYLFNQVLRSIKRNESRVI